MKLSIEHDADGPFFLLLDNRIRMKIRPNMEKRIDVGRRTDLLARAVGFRKYKNAKIVDATAGLCRDAFHMACLGFEVTALEMNKKIYEVVLPYVENFTFLNQAAKDYFSKLSEQDRPDVVYLDPMFPGPERKSKPGKESILLQQLATIPNEHEELDLLLTSLRYARKRVVVKRPRHAPILAKSLIDKTTGELMKGLSLDPKVRVSGKSIRYDIYLVSP